VETSSPHVETLEGLDHSVVVLGVDFEYRQAWIIDVVSHPLRCGDVIVADDNLIERRVLSEVARRVFTDGARAAQR
jgi:hypothetical protein